MLLSANSKFLDINVHLLPLLERRRLEEVTKLRKCCPCKNSRAIAESYELELKFLIHSDLIKEQFRQISKDSGLVCSFQIGEAKRHRISGSA